MIDVREGDSKLKIWLLNRYKIEKKTLTSKNIIWNIFLLNFTLYVIFFVAQIACEQWKNFKKIYWKNDANIFTLVFVFFFEGDEEVSLFSSKCVCNLNEHEFKPQPLDL